MLNAVAAAFDKVHCTVELLLLRGIGLPSTNWCICFIVCLLHFFLKFFFFENSKGGIEAELVGRMKAQQEKRTATFQQQIDFGMPKKKKKQITFKF